MTEEAKKLLEKSDHALEVADKLLKDGYYSDSAGKSYYSMFYAAQALLKIEGIDVIKHSAVESAFGYHFVKSGKVDVRYHKMLMDARKVRERADYGIQENIPRPTAEIKLKEGKEFLAEIKKVSLVRQKEKSQEKVQKKELNGGQGLEL